MRRFDKNKNIHKVNILTEQRYLESKGLIKEGGQMNLPIQMEGNDLSPQEEEVYNDIISEMDTLNEGSFSSVLDKVKSYVSKGMLTAGILAALLATPGITSAQSDAINNSANIEQADSGSLGSLMSDLGMEKGSDEDGYTDSYNWDDQTSETYIQTYTNPENASEYIIDAKVGGERIVKRFNVKDFKNIKNTVSELLSGSSNNYIK